MANDEAALNVRLADALQPKNPRWQVAAHQLGVLGGGRQPDLVVTHENSAPVILEVEYLPAAGVEREARGRVGEMLQPANQRVESVIAIAAPSRLRDVPAGSLAAELERVDFEYCLYSARDLRGETVRWPANGWLSGDVNYLANLIEHAAVSERLLTSSLQTLEQGVGQAAARLEGFIESGAAFGPRIAERLHQEEGEQTLRMAMAIVANALVFHTSLLHLDGVADFDKFRASDGRTIVPDRVINSWRRILSDINYWPIFSIAVSILRVIPTRPAAAALTALVDAAQELAAIGVTRSHDLTGRMFQRLIADRKFLATFYTRPESAWLLSDLAAGMLVADWSSREQITALRIGDLACGTGTLLSAAYGAISSRYRHAGGDDSEIHADMMASALIGADIMPAATHLTTSMLSSAHPSVEFDRTQIYTLPYGSYSSTHTSIGSLDLIGGHIGHDLFGPGDAAIRGSTPSERGSDFELPNDYLDLVIMNPPFTRPTNHKLSGVPVPSFAGFGTSSQEQAEMSRILGQMRSELEHAPAGNGNAGLATNFLDLAHLKLRPEGVLALVMPLSILQGAAWRAARALLEKSYRDLTVVTIAGASSLDKSFSADTGMGETLILGRKSGPEDSSYNPVNFVNLRNRPRDLNEAIQIARSVREFTRGEALCDHIRIGSDRSGNCVRGTLDDAGLAGVADAELALAAMSLSEGRLGIPGRTTGCDIPVTTLGSLGKRGLVDRDINGRNADGSSRGPFDIVEIAGAPNFPALWAHAATRERQFRVQADSMGEIRPGMHEAAKRVWESASHLHVNRDFRLNSQSLTACITESRTIGGAAWPNFNLSQSAWEAPILLWMNSTLGLVSYWWVGNRQQSGRVRTSVSRLPGLLALAAERMSADQLLRALNCVESLGARTFLPANEAWRDEARHELDRRLLVDVLMLPSAALESVDLLRRKWCAEPSVHGGKASRPPWSF